MSPIAPVIHTAAEYIAIRDFDTDKIRFYALNGAIMLAEGGFSKLMALPHVAIWTPMLGLVAWLLAQDIAPAYRGYLLILLVIDTVSLVFDALDTRKWLSGDREVA